MANEATLMFETGMPIPFTVADGAGIEKGTLCQLTDPMTASATSADGEFFAGIAAEEKVASDGRTKLALHTQGVFRVKDSGAGVTAGQLCKIAGANTVATADDDQIENHCEVVGKALETAAASETFLIQIGVY